MTKLYLAVALMLGIGTAIGQTTPLTQRIERDLQVPCDWQLKQSEFQHNSYTALHDESSIAIQYDDGDIRVFDIDKLVELDLITRDSLSLSFVRFIEKFENCKE